MKINFQTVLISIVTFVLLLLVSCNPSHEYEKQEAAQIQNYLTTNPSLDFDLKASGLYYLEVRAGTGPAIVAHDTVYVKYTGKLLSGTVFDTNIGRPDTLRYPALENYLIPGFEEGVSYMKSGGKALLLIPSPLAYGPSGQYPINGYTPLLFDIEVVRIKPGPGK